jgi:protein FRG1
VVQPIVEQDTEEPLEGWVVCDRIQDFEGPLMIISIASDPLSILCAHEESDKVTWRKIAAPKPEEMEEDDEEPNVSNIEPSHIYQVFVAKKIPGTGEDNKPTKICLRSSYDKYLGVDKFGLVECRREAVGATEEWQIVQKEDGFALQSCYDKFIKMDAAEGKTTATVIARADSESVGFLETIQFKCQAGYKFKEKKKEKIEQELDAGDLEIEKM